MVDVLIVGAGPVGLSLALMLNKCGVKFRIIEKGVAAEYYARAVAIQSRTLEILRQLDVLDSVIAQGCKMEFGIDIYSEGELIVNTKFPLGDTPFPGIVSLAQSDTERILEEKLRSLGLSVEYNVELIDIAFNSKHEATSATVKSLESGEVENIKAPYIVGCDGGRSTTRKLAGIPFAGETANITISVLDGEIETSIPGRKFHTIFFSAHTCVLMERISRKMIRFIIPSEGKQPHLIEEEFIQKVKATISPYTIKVDRVVRKNSFILNERRAQFHFKENIFLCGDSAHVHSPAGGQGLNMGIQDAYNLAWKLSLMIQGLGQHRVLSESFDSERGRVAEQVLESSGKLTRFALPKSSLLSYISRNFIMPYALSNLQIKQHISSLLSELFIKYGVGPLTRASNQPGILHWPFPGLGLRFPDFPVVHSTYHTTSSVHQFLVGGHCFEIFIHFPRRMFLLDAIEDLYLLLQTAASCPILKLKSSGPLFKTTSILKADMFQIHQWASSLICQCCEKQSTIEKTKKLLIATDLLIDQLGSLQRQFLLPDNSATLLVLRPDSHLGLIHPISHHNFSDILNSYFASFMHI
ncbi:hypothetical protein DSO57_1008664 [Entomophthora muscae]|uniref:Uncharacterized protein n=3 Tax=Entomophthora muscae TaxID=34485 RepID=A0ACC2T732_9FUNG|nr:hypothetical protein DSO57_1008664 [Entomophthora muscae]